MSLTWQNERVCLPFLDALGHLGEAGVTLGLDGGLRAGRAQHAVARGHPRALEAKIKSKKSLKLRGNGGLDGSGRLSGKPGHACPASGESIQACKPSKPSARS